MKREARYAPVGRCIYCGAVPDSDEHIIARSLGGRLILPDASCESCRRITSAIEDHCVEELFRSARMQFGFPTRHKKRGPKRPRTLHVDGVERRVPDPEYPGLMVGFRFNIPDALGLGPAAAAVFTGGVEVRVLPEFGERLNRIRRGVSEVRFGSRLQARQFGRMLAKIAHGYAVAELGLDGFRPTLLDIILNDDPQFIGRHVGGALDDSPASDELHEIKVDDFFARRWVVVEVRLFANRGMPTYWVVAGEPL
jgi:hypothetical protein